MRRGASAVASGASSRSIWAMGCWSTSATPSARGRCRAGRTRRAGTGRCGQRPQDARCTPDPCRHRNGTGRRRRSFGSGASQEQAIVGETPNLAARLQGIGEPNAVVIAESTRKLVGNLFEFQNLGAQDLKGISGPVQAWAALRPASVESRFDALHASGVTELVGREEELELLSRRWSRAKTGEGQVVLLSGEPGIGKSRLTAALMERLATEPHTRLRYFCSPTHRQRALPDHQPDGAGCWVHARRNGAAKLNKLNALLTQSFTPRQDAATFAEMLSLPNDGRFPTLELARSSADRDARNADRANRSIVPFDPVPDDFRGRALARPDQP